MSSRFALVAENAPLTAYTVAAPCRCDTLTATLRSVYGDADDTKSFGDQPFWDQPFGDLLRVLDRIEIAPQRM